MCTPCPDRQLGREGKTPISKDQFCPSPELLPWRRVGP
jgi:hypothetical protein